MRERLGRGGKEVRDKERENRVINASKKTQ